MTDNIFFTEIGCEERMTEEQNEQLANLKIKPELMWMKIAIDLTSIVAVRENMAEDGSPQVTLYTECDNFTVKGNYDEIVQRWLRFKDKRH